MTNEEFVLFIDPSNTVTQLLLAYFIAIQLVVAPLAHHEWPDNMNNARAEVTTGLIEWVEKIFESVPADLLIYLMWPMDIVNSVRAEIAGQGTFPSRVLQLKSPQTV